MVDVGESTASCYRNDLTVRELDMAGKIDPKLKTLAEKVMEAAPNSRASKVLRVLLKKGSITTDDLNELGYNHPPRAIGDVRDADIPIVTGSGTSRSGSRMAVYRFGDVSLIQEGRIGGRSAFPKAFKAQLIAHYGSKDCITGATLDAKVLQIDHRIPYRISGDIGNLAAEDFMLLDGSSQRGKSWACEHCPNMTIRDPDTCRSCFWAFPEDYLHIATEQIRRVEVSWQGVDVAVHDRLKADAAKQHKSVADLIREWARQRGKSS